MSQNNVHFSTHRVIIAMSHPADPVKTKSRAEAETDLMKAGFSLKKKKPTGGLKAVKSAMAFKETIYQQFLPRYTP